MKSENAFLRMRGLSCLLMAMAKKLVWELMRRKWVYGLRLEAPVLLRSRCHFRFVIAVAEAEVSL